MKLDEYPIELKLEKLSEFIVKALRSEHENIRLSASLMRSYRCFHETTKADLEVIDYLDHYPTGKFTKDNGFVEYLIKMGFRDG